MKCSNFQILNKVEMDFLCPLLWLFKILRCLKNFKVSYQKLGLNVMSKIDTEQDFSKLWKFYSRNLYSDSNLKNLTYEKNSEIAPEKNWCKICNFQILKLAKINSEVLQFEYQSSISENLLFFSVRKCFVKCDPKK